MTRPGWKPCLWTALVAAMLGGCASPDPDRFARGASIASVVQTMGRASAEYAAPDGGKALEYATGPYGKSTLLFRFDAAGQLLDARQALTELQFNRIQPGMAASEVLLQLGRPSTIWRLAFQQQSVWSYRYESPFCQWFMVGVGGDGKVVDSAYGPDPVCSVDSPM